MPKMTIKEAIQVLRANQLTEIDLSHSDNNPIPLSMGDNEWDTYYFSQDNIHEFTAALAQNTSVTHMNLVNNAVYYPGWHYLFNSRGELGEKIANALKSNRTLLSLEISDTNDQNSSAIKAVLKANNARASNWARVTLTLGAAQTKSNIATSSIPLAEEVSSFLYESNPSTRVNLHRFWGNSYFKSQIPDDKTSEQKKGCETDAVKSISVMVYYV